MGIYLGKDYSAMQGPAPDGFHVPLNTEWQTVYDIWTALGGGSSDGSSFGIALKLPFAGNRDYSTGGVSNQGSYGMYRSSTRYNESRAYRLGFNSSSISPQVNSNRAAGMSVRCFKNSPTMPTSSWTKLYGTSIAAGGIFWSSTDGLISLSSDGNTWITIADKNLGATTVWDENSPSYSESNCGKYYQRGNNYGFPRAGTGSITTSSTQVDASNYGPGNYYSSSTFIQRSSSPYRWDTTDNGNLRGGVTGIIPTELKNAYIGERNPFMDYQEVEYIQSTATNPGTTSSSGQVINTGFTHTPNTKVEIVYQYLSTTVQQRMFGTETTSTSYSTFVTYINGSGKRARATKDGEGNWQSTDVTADTNKHTFVLDKSTYKIYTNGTQIHSGSNAYTMTKNGQYPLAIFATRNSGYSSYIEHASAKLYACKIWDNNVLVRDFAPCYRKSDNEIGLWDKVNNEFYPNAGTGTFTKGPDVN